MLLFVIQRGSLVKFHSLDQSRSVTIIWKAIEQYFYVALFVLPYSVGITF